MSLVKKGACNGDNKYDDDPQDIFTQGHCGNSGIRSTIDSTVLGIWIERAKQQDCYGLRRLRRDGNGQHERIPE